MDYARSLLEELMNPYEQSSRKSFTDDDVCKDYLVDFCPNDLFVNTKADLGPCRKVHDDRLKKDYQESKAKNRYPYEDSFASTLRLLINDLERKMRRAQEKLDAAFPEDALHSKKAEAEEKSVIIDEKIKSLLALAESAGEEGRITEAKIYTNQIELLQSELEKLKNGVPTATDDGSKHMEVCSICGALLVPGDEQKRLEAHITGKMHTGYARIRNALEEMKKKADKIPSEPSRGRREDGSPHEGSRYGRYHRSSHDYYSRDNPSDRRRSRERSPRRRSSRDLSSDRRRSRV
ncbi:splicing factor [Entomophthora muscae]|uniref:Splicing factor n=1 Tax=Entomophthora muscae TaxID=34485 RepID=A0ACC2ULE8_9FUNG|nr:splicing factor [Entomophthora muscae]